MGQIAYPPIPFAFTGFANPAAQIGLAAVNGAATTAMRSDAAPALSQAIAPTWTATHIFAPTTSGANPMVLGASGNAADLKYWRYRVGGGGDLQLNMLMDDMVTSKGAFQLIRSTTAVTGQNYGNSVDNPLHLYFGLLRLNSYGAGTLTTDASGNVTAVSDASLKRDVRPFEAGLQAILAIEAIKHGWKEETGLDQSRDDYVGFIAQQVAAVIPEAVGRMRVEKSRQLKPAVVAARRAVPESAAAEEAAILSPLTDEDFDIEYDQQAPLTFNDRAVLAALVNAVKELAQALEIKRREEVQPGLFTRAFKSLFGDAP